MHVLLEIREYMAELRLQRDSLQDKLSSKDVECEALRQGIVAAFELDRQYRQQLASKDSTIKIQAATNKRLEAALVSIKVNIARVDSLLG